MSHFTSDAEIDRIGRCLLDRSLPKSEWTHAAHFAAAVWLLGRPNMNAARDMPGLIRAYNEATGVANTDTSGYHETITLGSLRASRAWLAETARSRRCTKLSMSCWLRGTAVRIGCSHTGRSRCCSPLPRVEPGWSRTCSRCRSERPPVSARRCAGFLQQFISKSFPEVVSRLTQNIPVPHEILSRLRLACLDLPEALEEPAWAGTRWVVRKKNFAHVLMIDGGWPPAYALAAGTTAPRACSRSARRWLRSRHRDSRGRRSSGRCGFPTSWACSSMPERTGTMSPRSLSRATACWHRRSWWSSSIAREWCDSTACACHRKPAGARRVMASRNCKSSRYEGSRAGIRYAVPGSNERELPMHLFQKSPLTKALKGWLSDGGSLPERLQGHEKAQVLTVAEARLVCAAIDRARHALAGSDDYSG